MRSKGGAGYENAVNLWIRSNGAIGTEPVPWDVDEGLYNISLAHILGVPVHKLHQVPPLMIRDARIQLELDRRAKQQQAEANQGSSGKSHRPAGPAGYQRNQVRG